MSVAFGEDSAQYREFSISIARVEIVYNVNIIGGLGRVKKATNGLSWETHPNTLSFARVLQGCAWYRIGDMREVIAFLKVASDSYDTDFWRLDWAKVNYLLSSAHKRLSVKEDRHQNIVSSIEGFLQCGRVFLSSRAYLCFRMATQNLAVVCGSLWQWVGRRDEATYDMLITHLKNSLMLLTNSLQTAPEALDCEDKIQVEEGIELTRALLRSCGGDRTKEEHREEFRMLDKRIEQHSSDPEQHSSDPCHDEVGKSLKRQIVIAIRDLWDNETGVKKANDFLLWIGDRSMPLTVWGMVWKGTAYLQASKPDEALAELHKARNLCAAQAEQVFDISKIDNLISSARLLKVMKHKQGPLATSSRSIEDVMMRDADADADADSMKEAIDSEATKRDSPRDCNVEENKRIKRDKSEENQHLDKVEEQTKSR